MKLLLICNSYPSERYPQYATWAVSIESCLRKAGCSLDLLVIQYKRDNVLFKLMKYIDFSIKLMNEDMSRYDIIYINYPTHALPIFLNKTLTANKLFLHWHGFDLLGNGIYNKLARKYLQSRAMQCWHVTPSFFYKKIVGGKFQVEENKIIVSPSGGVNTNIFVKSKKNDNEKRFNVGFASGLDPHKGVVLFSEIMRRHKELEVKLGLTIEFSVIEYGDMAKENIIFFKKNKFPVHFWPKMKKNEMPRFYNTIDLLLFPSCVSESLGLVVLEAMSCGVPVITFDFCAFPEFVISNVSGEKVELKDSFDDNLEGFIRAIVHVKDNRHLYRPRDIVIEKYSEDMTIKNYKTDLDMIASLNEDSDKFTNNVRLFGLKIYADGMERLISDVKNSYNKIHIISGNAEVLKYPLGNMDIYKLFNAEGNIIIPDGISVCFPAKTKYRYCEKIPGIELMEKLLLEFQDTGKSVYFLGAKEEVLDKMIVRFKNIYPLLKIAGYHHGFFDKNNCGNIIAEIKKSQAYALLVALGTPTQENFIFKYMEKLPCSVFMGVGGSFDVFSGTVKRAPKWMCNLGIEWLYRLFSDPSKLGRVLTNIKFTIAAFVRG